MAPVLAQLDNVSRMFGRFPALRKVSISFTSGCCYVLLGENGAGKSTLLRILAGLLEPSLGSARILSDGKPEKIANQRARIGYMSHAPMLYDELTAHGKPALLRRPLPYLLLPYAGGGAACCGSRSER